MTATQILLPPKLVPVFTGEAMYRGAYGGRGSAKTRSFAKMAAVRAMMWAAEGREGIILCGREFMNSLADSSYMSPKKYGDKVSQEVSGPDGGAVATITRIELVAAPIPAGMGEE